MIHFLTAFEPLILVFHVILCIFMVIVILLQAGKGADMGAAFGAGSSQTLFGARGAATFLQKITTGAALFFLLTSITLAAIHRNRSSIRGGNSVVGETDVPLVPQTVPEKSASESKTSTAPEENTAEHNVTQPTPQASEPTQEQTKKPTIPAEKKK